MTLSKTSILTLTLWTLLALYFGVSGICTLYLEEELDKLAQKKEELKKVEMKRIIDDKPEVTNKYDYDYVMTVSRYERVFPLVGTIPDFLGMILTAMCFSLVGAVTGIILRIARDEYTEPDQVKHFSEPILGLLTGLCVLGISYVLPTVLVFNASSIRPITLMFFSLFCGIYTKGFFEKLTGFFAKFFKTS